MFRFNSLNKVSMFFSIFSLFSLLFSCNFLISITSPAIKVVFLFSALVLFFSLYKRVLVKINSFSILSILIGVFAAIINIFGKSFMLYNSMVFYYKDNLLAVVVILMAAIGYGVIYASIFELGWHQLSESKNHKSKTNVFINNLNFIFFDKHPLLYPFLLICLFWFPYFIGFFPGMLQWDAMYALRSYYGIEIWTTHHPVIGVLLMGYIMDIGKYFGNDNYGCLIYIVLQYLTFSLALAYFFVFFNKWKVFYSIRWIVLLVFLLHPLFPTFVMNEVKDIFYYVVILWLLFLLIECYKKYSIVYSLYITFASMFVCALRKEGIIICVFCLFILVLFRHNIYENWKNISVALVIGSTLAVLASNVSANYYNVKQASMREALSIPLQQTARYIRDYSEDVSCSEWSVLNSVFQNHAKDLGLYYQPEKSDQVKDLMGYNLTKKQIMAYFEVWFNQFMRHPGCYLSAAFNQFYGYFYIEKEAMYRIGDCRLLNFKSGHPLFTEQIVVVDNPNTKNIRERIINYVLSWPDLPLLGLLYHPAIYTWSLFFGLSCLIYFKKYKYMFLYSIPLIILFICCLSPVNAFIRYSFPIILSSFILTTFSVTIIREQDVT